MDNDDVQAFARVLGWNQTSHGDRCLLSATATIDICGLQDDRCNAQCARDFVTNNPLSWRDAELTNPAGEAAASVDIEDVATLGAQYGNLDWGDAALRVDIDGDQRVSYKDYYMVATQSFGVDLGVPAPAAPGDPPNALTCYYLPSYFETAMANPATFTWCQTDGADPCQDNCQRHHTSGELIPMSSADFNFDGVIDIVDLAIIGKWYGQGYGRNDRQGFERVNWYRDNDLTLEDWIRFGRGKDRCNEINGYGPVLGICEVCDDDPTTLPLDGDPGDCCDDDPTSATPDCNW